MSAYKEPTLSKKVVEQYTNQGKPVPPSILNELQKRHQMWQENCAAQQVRKDRLRNMKQTQSTQDLMDVMYRWAAGPGEFSSPTLRPLAWTGCMNIHYCQQWWVSHVCLYISYPFVSSELYQVIKGLHEIIKRIFAMAQPSTI